MVTVTLLKVEDLSISFGGLRAVFGFNLDLKPGELVGLIGPNGAGKTTVLIFSPVFTSHRRDGSFLTARKSPVWAAIRLTGLGSAEPFRISGSLMN